MACGRYYKVAADGGFAVRVEEPAEVVDGPNPKSYQEFKDP